MITLDQVMLLEQKVESAVEKIQQLQAENDALRTKCEELTNALSSKTEQLSSFETDQNQIESGIKKALDRLLYIENSVLKNGAVSTQAAPAQAQASKPAVSEQALPTQNTQPAAQPHFTAQTQQSEPSGQITQPNQPQVQTYVQYNQSPVQTVQEDLGTEPSFTPQEPNFDSMQDTVSDEIPPEEDFGDEEESQDNLGFDIF